MQKVYDNIVACDPVFKEAKIIDSAVLRFGNAVTHFSPGSYKDRPTQQTSINNIFLAGDYVKDVPHGANGLSQERAYVTGLIAANNVLAHIGEGESAVIRPAKSDEPHIVLAKEINKAASQIQNPLFDFLPKSTF